MLKPTPAQDFAAAAILTCAALWTAFGYGMWRLLRGSDGINDLGSTDEG